MYRPVWNRTVSPALPSALLAACLLFLLLLALPARAFAAEGSLQVKPGEGVQPGATYSAYLISSDASTPVTDALDWQSLGGLRLGSPEAEPLPQFDDASKLVAEVARRAAADEDGSFSAAVAAHLRADAAPAATLVSGGEAVSLQSGWYLLVSPGRRPLFVPIFGTAVTANEKSVPPVLTKEVDDGSGSGYGSSGVYGSGRSMSYRIAFTVPTEYQRLSSYRVVFHDEYDERLALDAASLRVLLRPEGPASSDGEQDLTAQATLEQAGHAFTVTLSDLKAAGAKPGDSLVLAYRMLPDTLAAADLTGLLNSAWADYPTVDGAGGTTPPSEARVYSARLVIHKESTDGTPLAGAVFALADARGRWLQPDGAFGDQATRATFATGSDGSAQIGPSLSEGGYTLVELEAPAGYRMAPNPRSSIVLSTSPSPDGLSLTATADGIATVEQVDAQSSTVSLRVVNAPDTPAEFLPKLSDAAEWLPALFAVAVLAALVLLKVRDAKRGLR